MQSKPLDIFQINNAEMHDVRYFAMFNNAVAISGDPKLEGGTHSKALAYYNYLLNIQLPNCPLTLNLSKEQTQALNKRMSNLIRMDGLIEKKVHDQSIYTNESMDEIIHLIDQNCTEDTCSYFPSGFTNHSTGDGHFAGLKIRKLEDGSYAISCINQGAGINYHKKISISGSKVKYSYQSDEFKIDLKQAKGREFIKKIIELNYDNKQTKDTKEITNPYSEHDLYGLLHTYGKKLSPLQPEQMQEKSVTPQRTGTCPITNTHAMARDSLIDTKANFNNRKHYHFVMKLRSLIDAFDKFRKGKYPLNVLEWALHEFSVRLNKQYKTILSDEEIIYCSEIQEKIKDELNKEKIKTIKQKCEPKKYPNLTSEAPKYKQAIFDISKIKKPTTVDASIESQKKKVIDKNKITPIKVLSLINKISSSHFNEIVSFFNMLPHCSGLDKDEFWDKVHNQDIEAIIRNLYAIIDTLNRMPSYSPLVRAKKFAVSLIVYDITAQLAPRLSRLNLSNQYTFGLDDVYSEQHFFSDPIVYYTVKRVAENFARRAQNKKRVFTNAVNYDENRYDETVKYVVNVLLTEHQREVIKKAREKEEKRSNAHYTDTQLFDFLVRHLEIIDTERGCDLIEDYIKKIIAIAGTAHAMGTRTETYNQINQLWGFNKANAFHDGITRQSQYKNNAIKEMETHLPIVMLGSDEYKDFSENTIYHSLYNLLQIRAEAKDTFLKSIPPYQPQLSGSFHNNSKIWEPKTNQQFFYELLNEELRSIECSPNFHVVKAFDWAANNLDKLRNKDVRERINELIFQYGKLDLAFSKQFETSLLNIQIFFMSLLKYCNEDTQEDVDLLVWANNLAYDIRYYLEVAAKLYHLPVEKLTLPSFKELTLKRIQSESDNNIRSKFASQIILSYRNASPLSLDDCCLLIISRVIANLGDEAPLSTETWQNLNDEIIEKIKSENNDTVANKLNGLIAKYNITTIKNWQLNKLGLQAEGTDFFINLVTGALQVKGELEPKKERTQKIIADNKALFKSLHFSQDTKLFYSDSTREIKSDNGKWQFDYKIIENSDLNTAFLINQTYQFITIENITSKFKLLTPQEVNQFFGKNPFESEQEVCSHYLYWQSLDDNDLIYVRHGNENVAYTYSKNNDLILLTAENEDDFRLSKLQDISRVNNNNPILIKYNDKFYVYGFVEPSWNLTPLEHANKTFMNAAHELPFNEIKIIDSEKRRPLINRIRDVKKAVQDEINKAHTITKNPGIYQHSIKPSGEWQRDDNILLNLVNPQTEFEQQWANRLAPMFGVANICCRAVLSKDRTTCQIKSISHLTLNLSFVINEKNQLMCNEIPNFHLSTEPSLEILHGAPNVVILENDKGDKKYLIPAFEFNTGEKNNALNHDDMIDYTNLRNKSRPYFSYTLNAQNELISEKTETNPLQAIEDHLYLALLYRNLGDFERAIKYLERCKTHLNINPQIGKLILQILKRRINSPTGVAFDLKLASYLKEHMEKWSKHTKSDLEFKLPDNWDDFIKIKCDFYRKTFSSYKSEIAIIPSYLRLTQHEFDILGPVVGDMIAQTNIYPSIPNMRIENSSQLPREIFSADPYTWRRYVNETLKPKAKKIQVPKANSGQSAIDLFTTMRTYSTEKDYAFDYILNNFTALFMDAISNKKERTQNLERVLFSLLQNDSTPNSHLDKLIALLKFSQNYFYFFSNFDIPEDNFKLIEKVGEIFYSHAKDLENAHLYVFQYDDNPYRINKEKPIGSNFVAQPVKFAMIPTQYEKECKQPLGKLAERFLTKREESVAKGDFALTIKDFDNPTLLEKKLFNHFKSGHDKNKDKMKTVYSIEGERLNELKSELVTLNEKDEHKAKELKISLLKKSNHTPLDDEKSTIEEKARAYNLLQARANGQKHEISMTDLFTAFLQKNPSLLTEQNPFLKQHDIETLFADLADYALLHSRIDQNKQATEIIDNKKSFNEILPYQQQLLAGILDKTRAYDVNEYPEFLVYEYATHRILREDQIKVLKNLMMLIEKESANASDIHHALLQFAAGGGKTSVLIPILAQRFARKGFLPVIINTSELYQIGLEDIPKNLRASFEQNLEVIEYELEHQWTQPELIQLHHDLEKWRSERKCLLIKSVTWHSIHIAMKSAYFNKDIQTAKAAQKVLDFFKTKSVKLEDECHIVSNPLQQSIKTEGNQQKLPHSHLNFLLRVYDYLMGRDGAASGIEKLAGVKSNRARPITAAELDTLQKKLAQVLVNEECFKELPAQDLISYWLQADKNRPSWLDHLYKTGGRQREIADLVVLARAFIKTHLPHILTLQYRKDFGTSLHQSDSTVAPYHEGNPAYSHFGDHTLVAALTIQLYEQRGLQPEQVDELFEALHAEHRNERDWNMAQPTQIELLLKNIIPGFKTHKDLTPALKIKLREDPLFTKHPDIIKKYLREFALPQVKVPERRITSTAAEMQAGFTRSILFSATPSLPEIYPGFIDEKNTFLEETFEAQVIDTLLQEQNRKQPSLLKKSQNPTEFFNQFSPKLLTRMKTLIDRGSLLTQFEVEDVIKAYLGLDKTLTQTQTAAGFVKGKDAKQAMHLKTKDPNVQEDVYIAGADLANALKKQGIKPEEFLLFLFLDLSKTTGTDIKRPFKDHAGVTVGKGQTVTETIQAAMRERQLLDENAQTITWIMFRSLYREINPCELVAVKNIDAIDTLPIKANTAYVSCGNKLFYINKSTNTRTEIFTTEKTFNEFKSDLNPTDVARKLSKEELEKISEITQHSLAEAFDPKSLFYWLLKNEAKEIESKLIARAYQGIQQAITEVVWKIIQNDPQTLPIYEKALEEKQEISPFLIYELPSKKDATNLVLTSYMNGLLEKFTLKKEDIPQGTMQRINKIIQETTSLVPELDESAKTPLNMEVQQEMEQVQKQEQKQKQEQRVTTRNDTLTNFKFAVEEYSYKQDNLNIIFNKKVKKNTRHYQTPRLPGCEDIKQPELLICPDHFAVMQRNKKENDTTIEELKPIQQLLIKIMPDKIEHLACTGAGLEFYADQMNKINTDSKYPAYAIISKYGAVLHTSKNISASEVNHLIQKEESQKIITYANFLNGEITNPITLSQIVKEQGWNKDQYERIANAIANVHVSKHPVKLQVNEVLETYCGWNDKKQEVKTETNIKEGKLEEKIYVDSQQEIHTLMTLENYIETTSALSAQPQHALADDLLGKKPIPMSKIVLSELPMEGKAYKQEQFFIDKKSSISMDAQPNALLFVAEPSVKVKSSTNKDTIQLSAHNFIVDLKNDLKKTYAKEGIGFLRLETPQHIKSLQKLTNSNQGEDPTLTTIEVIKTLLHAKDHPALFRSKVILNLYNRHLVAGLNALETTEEKFRADHKIDQTMLGEFFQKIRQNL